MTIPSFVKPFLWSYDLRKVDPRKNRDRIITNVLNLGTREATEWRLKSYSRGEIRKALKNPRPGEWSKKSLNYWCLVLDVPVDKDLTNKARARRFAK